MAARNLTMDALVTAVKNGTAYTGAGQLDGASRTFLLQPQGQLSEASQYDELIIGQANGAPLRGKDVAVVKDTLQDERIKMRFWMLGQHIPAATVMISVFTLPRS